jgi:hypothetical protein
MGIQTMSRIFSSRYEVGIYLFYKRIYCRFSLSKKKVTIKNVINTSLRIVNPQANASTEIFYKDSAELHHIYLER